MTICSSKVLRSGGKSLIPAGAKGKAPVPKAIPIEVRLSLSKKFPSGTESSQVGRYNLRPVPTLLEGCEIVLSFIDTFEGTPGGGSHPEEEATAVARCLALSVDAVVRRTGLRVGHADVPNQENRGSAAYPQFHGICDPIPFQKQMSSICSLPDDLARQFLRAAHSYSFALEFIPSDPTFAFFLLVVAAECLSCQDAVIPNAELDRDRCKCERFCRFLTSMVPAAVRTPDETDVALFTQLLKTAYYSHRSAFVHGGSEVSDAALLADKAGSSYMKHMINGKEVKTPGLNWFARVVRLALLGCLDHLSPVLPMVDEHRLARLSFEKAGLQVKAKRGVTAGQIVTFDDIEFR